MIETDMVVVFPAATWHLGYIRANYTYHVKDIWGLAAVHVVGHQPFVVMKDLSLRKGGLVKHLDIQTEYRSVLPEQVVEVVLVRSD